MDDLISRAAAIEHMKTMAGCATCNNYKYVLCRACNWNDAMNIVEEMPAVDAAPVVHAHWIKYEPDMHGTEPLACSACNYLFARLYPQNYCPNCGAKNVEE